MAVHFGHFPGDGQPAQAVQTYASMEPVTSAGAPDPRQPALGAGKPAAQAVSADTRRRPDTSVPVLASTLPPPAPASTPSQQPVQRRFEPPAAKPVVTQPVILAARDPEPEPQADEPAADQAESDRLADLAAALEDIEEEAPAPAPPAKAKPAAAPARQAARQAASGGTTQRERASTATAKKPPVPAREAARVWVQVAGGANKSWLPREFARLKAKAPKLLGSRTAWTVPVSATNRLLVGPFASGREAQSFINELAKMGVSGFAWTSAAGQKVERLAAR
jgi:hypothetical protein